MEASAVYGLAMIIWLGVIVLGFCILSLFLLWAAKIAGIEGRSFGRAFLATILTGVATFVFSAASTLMLPALSLFLNSVCGFLLHALVIMPIFRTTFGKALGAAVLAWVLSIIVFGALALLVFGGLLALPS